jgi:hypothetical protein
LGTIKSIAGHFVVGGFVLSLRRAGHLRSLVTIVVMSKPNSSYFFNGLPPDQPPPRMGGKPFSAVRQPSRLILGGEL